MSDTNETVKKMRKMEKRGPKLPTHDDPRKELRLLVTQHKATQLTRTRLENASATRVAKKDDKGRGITKGDKIPSPLPANVRALNANHVKELKEEEAKLKASMLRQLKQVEVYKQWLGKVYGFGEVACAYLLADVDITKCEKPSGLRRFAGMAVINGRLERRARGQKSRFNSALRVKLYSAFVSMVKNGAKGAHCKYLRIWGDAMHRKLSMPDWNPTYSDGRAKSKAVAARQYGWHKACDVFLEDLYVVWRALEGLPVWPSYYAAKLGYEHGGKISVNAPKPLTVEEAIALVGHVGSIPGKLDALYAAKVEADDLDPDDITEDDFDRAFDVAAEE